MASDMFLLVPLSFMRACAPWSCLGGVNSKQERAAGCRRPQMAMGMSASPVGHAQPQMAHTPSQSCQVHQLLWIDTLNLDGIVTEHVPVRRSNIFRSYTQYSDIIGWGRLWYHRIHLPDCCIMIHEILFFSELIITVNEMDNQAWEVSGLLHRYWKHCPFRIYLIWNYIRSYFGLQILLSVNIPAFF
ncbi:hypothetical protein PVAP13_9KG355800 [Panicum virgatum]|nr:hypothetical protein PVAP13_9KG355800 [Panicum virgatum]